MRWSFHPTSSMRPLTYLSTTLLTRHPASNRYLPRNACLPHSKADTMMLKKLAVYRHMLSNTPLPSLDFPVPTSELTQILPLSPSEFPERDLSGGEQRKCFDEEIEPMASLPISSAPRRRNSRAAPGLRLSDKRNLPCAAIPAVADLLVMPNAISCFLSHCRLVYESWLPSFASNSLDDSYSINTRVIAALDRVQDLLDGNRICRLLLRFAHLQLAWSIGSYKVVAVQCRKKLFVLEICLDLVWRALLEMNSMLSY
jgi:hypothetical protein